MTVPLRIVAGTFYRAVAADRVDDVLRRPAADHAGRYHRPGQAALYVTGEADWAVIAVGQYWVADGRDRVVVPLQVSEARVLDQHDSAACLALGVDRDQSNTSWQAALANGVEPSSWHTADAARAAGADGLIDRSRGIVGGWHVVLFDWNVPGAPTVAVAGPPLTISYAAARARWPSPAGWQSPI